jgi:DNA polymerase
MDMADRTQLLRALEWQVAAGADEAIGDTARDRYAPPPVSARQTDAPQPLPAAFTNPTPDVPPAQGEPAPVPGGEARSIAASIESLEELYAAIEAFDGCALKTTAKNTVIADGIAGAPVMLLGEAPGAEEDDLMLGSVGLSRQENAYISNIMFWRPPGNRNPSTEEIASCRPFVDRHIELIKPKVLVFLGAPAAQTLLGRSEGITKMRGRWFNFRIAGMEEQDMPPIPAIATFHPAYLLRTPLQKRFVWQDMLAIRERLDQD